MHGGVYLESYDGANGVDLDLLQHVRSFNGTERQDCDTRKFQRSRCAHLAWIEQDILTCPGSIECT